MNAFETDTRVRVILDPSVLFTEDALEWLSNPELREFLVISRALTERLESASDGQEFLPFASPDQEWIARVRSAIAENGVAEFSYGDALESGRFAEPAQEVGRRILDSDQPLADVLADEWAFLATQSIATIAGDVRDALRVFAEAGAHVVELTRERMEYVLDQVRDRLPEPVLENMKRTARVARRVPDWLIFGGSALSLVLPHIGIPITGFDGARKTLVLVAGDP